MIGVLLAAGYATRMYPLTENEPKALLKLGNKTILDTVMDKIEEIDEINRVYIVTNHKFYLAFSDWAGEYEGSKRIKILNDFSTSNENRLGAIADMQYAIERGDINEDILVMACDTVSGFSLSRFIGEYRNKDADMICAHVVEDADEIKSLGVVELGEDNMVIGFEEKPNEPKSDLSAPPFYIFKKDTLPLISKYLEEGNNPDAPGNFIPWLMKKKNVYAYRFDEVCIDVGTPEAYYELEKQYK